MRGLRLVQGRCTVGSIRDANRRPRAPLAALIPPLHRAPSVTERLWKRNLASQVSPEAFDSRRPCSVMNARPSLLMGPRVSTTIGTTVYVLESSAYFECFLVAAFFVALPASIAVSAT